MNAVNPFTAYVINKHICKGIEMTDGKKYRKYEYNLKELGILAGPEITYLKK